eukprot:scaffold2053_cov136-Skeletonema_marinoi.AAC.5
MHLLCSLRSAQQPVKDEQLLLLQSLLLQSAEATGTSCHDESNAQTTINQFFKFTTYTYAKVSRAPQHTYKQGLELECERE